jgi:hypothetical protein
VTDQARKLMELATHDSPEQAEAVKTSMEKLRDRSDLANRALGQSR